MARIKAEEWTTPDALLQIEAWARDGLTDADIAGNIGVSYTTFKTWIRKCPSILTALKNGKAPADVKVENALYKSATGYTVKVKVPLVVKTRKQLKDKGMIEEEKIEYAEKEIHIPGNTTAQIFWLKNRRPAAWRDRREFVAKSEGEQNDAQARADVAAMLDEVRSSVNQEAAKASEDGEEEGE